MKVFIVTTAAAVSLLASSAGAATFVSADGGAAAFAASAAGAQFTFETGATTNPPGFGSAGGQIVSGSNPGTWLQLLGSPANNQFLDVAANGSASITSAASWRKISLYMGSIDLGNNIELLGAGGVSLGVYTGGMLMGTGVVTGGNSPLISRLITFTAGDGEVLTGLRLSSTVDSLEADNIRFSSAVPELGTWLMMIVGLFGVGCIVRRSRRNDSSSFCKTSLSLTEVL